MEREDEEDQEKRCWTHYISCYFGGLDEHWETIRDDQRDEL